MHTRSGVLVVLLLLSSGSLICEAQDWTVDDLATRAIETGTGPIAQVRWTTRVPSKGWVEYGAAPTLGERVEEDSSSLRGSTNARESGRGFANNHRADVPWQAGKPFYYRVHATDAAGKEVTTETGSVSLPRTTLLAATASGRIPLQIDRCEWKLDSPPVVVGVPFARGVVFSAQALRLVSDGGALSFQPEVVSRYDDGSICWLRVSFLAPKLDSKVTLEYGRQVRPTSPTPHATVKVEGKSFRVIGASASIEGRTDGTGIVRLGTQDMPLPRAALIAGDGVTYSATPESVVVEEQGPIRTVVRIDGHHRSTDGKSHFGYVMRWYAFAGKPYLRCDYTFANDITTQEMTSFRQLDLRFDGLIGQPTVFTDGAPLTLTTGQRVIQREDSEWVVEPGTGKGKRLAGGVKCGGARLLVRHCWEQYPKSVGATGEGLALGICPALPAGFYAGRLDEDKLYFHLRDGNYAFRQGFSKTHTLWLAPASLPEADSLVGDPPVASCPPDYIEKTGALRGLAVAARDQFPGYDEALKATAENVLGRRAAQREYGIMNFGDWYGERAWNWGNLEYDMAHAMLTQFARTGDAVFFHRAAEAALHEGDVDTRHHATDDRRVGQQWIHSIGHTAGYYDNKYKDMKGYAGTGWSDNRGHIWAQGLCEHFLFGGDRRSWETAKLISDWAAGPQTTNFDFGNAREPGWMTILVMGAYNATRDPYYLNAARLMMRKVQEKSAATGGRGFYYHELPTGHCNCEKKHFGEAGFMLGVLMTGLKMYYDATRDPQAAEAITGIAKFIIDTMWEPDVMGFHYTSCPESGAGPASIAIMLEGLAFGAQRMKNEEINQILRQSLAASWQTIGGVGKHSAYSLCSLVQGLDQFARLPGSPFATYLAKIQAELKNPARRLLPTNVPNPDFEEDIAGWTPRGGEMVRTTNVKHSGAASLMWRGRLRGQNEYFNTRYDTGGDPTEITWLKPEVNYRLTCWLRVDKLSPGTPAPSLRVTYRDVHGSRGGQITNAYDLNRMGAWQKLSADGTIPEWNTGNYLALNTNSREAVEAELYLDDVSLSRVTESTEDSGAYLRGDVQQATLAAGASLASNGRPPQREYLRGPGSATWTIDIPHEGGFAIWVRAAGKGQLAILKVDGKSVGDLEGSAGTWAWVRVAVLKLTAGRHELTLDELSKDARLGRIVVTNDMAAVE